MDIAKLQKEIKKAADRIRPHILQTPVLSSGTFDTQKGVRVHLKLENRQHTGSFKLRGALNKVMSLSSGERERGVVTASTGNHGMGVARALQLTNTRGKIFLPNDAKASKVEKLAEFGAPIEFVEGSSLETELHAKKVAQQSGAVWISPYNDPMIIAGQGTIAVELLEQLDSFDTIYITVGGGGLISGVAAYLKTYLPTVRIIGCLPENSPEMCLSVKAGEIVTLEETKPTLSDGSAGGVEPGSITFPLCQKLIDDFILVSEEEIENAIRLVFQQLTERIEGSAGVAVAAFLKSGFASERSVVVVCGGNIDDQQFEQITRQ